MTEITVPDAIANVEPVKSVRTPIRMEYTYTPGRALTQYLRAMKNKVILGGRCPDTGDVYVPPRGVSPKSGRLYDEMVELAHVGHVKSFCITRLPIPGRDDLEIPYIAAWILPDGANVGFIGLVKGIEPGECRVGLRVRAVWKPDDELEESAENIPYWEPTGEPDHDTGGAK